MGQTARVPSYGYQPFPLGKCFEASKNHGIIWQMKPIEVIAKKSQDGNPTENGGGM